MTATHYHVDARGWCSAARWRTRGATARWTARHADQRARRRRRAVYEYPGPAEVGRELLHRQGRRRRAPEDSCRRQGAEHGKTLPTRGDCRSASTAACRSSTQRLAWRVPRAPDPVPAQPVRRAAVQLEHDRAVRPRAPVADVDLGDRFTAPVPPPAPGGTAGSMPERRPPCGEPQDEQEYAGAYYSEELEAGFTDRRIGDSTVAAARHRSDSPVLLARIGRRDTFRGARPDARFQRDAEQEVDGLTVDAGACEGLSSRSVETSPRLSGTKI